MKGDKNNDTFEVQVVQRNIPTTATSASTLSSEYEKEIPEKSTCDGLYTEDSGK